MITAPNWLSASIKLAIAAAVFSILPLFLTTLSDYFLLSKTQLNSLATVELMGFALACGINYQALKWGVRYNENFALAGLSICNLLSAMTADFTMFFMIRAVAGVLAGLVIVRGYEVLGSEENADAAFGKAIAIQMLFTAALFLFLPYWVQTYGPRSILFVLCALAAVCLLFKPLQSETTISSRPSEQLDYSLIFISLGAIAMVMMTHSAVWSTLGFYANARDITIEQQGYLFSIGTLFSVLGAILATLNWVHAKKSKLLPIAIGLQCLVVGVIVLDDSMSRFVAATFFFQLLWNFMLPLALGSIATGRHARVILCFVLVAQTFGAALGPLVLISGWVLPELTVMLFLTYWMMASVLKSSRA
ncbi:MFS transporter [Vibrio sinaloensis]|uniref:MFS transporter n=1 Tax=Photobacterium sp. (strain ATCC 43367) TaxID=379097 RepID=UPI0020661B2B|nr:MFS transporter [Vibrio sinaloensis]UPQ89459.1 MFS transporter [Vibrio sinaloensis]